MNRIFISYRTADEFKDATRLAVDLNRVFGNDQVFLDKQDLRGGSSWRDEIMGALGTRPVLRGVQLQSQSETAVITTNDPAPIDLAGEWDVEMVGKGPLPKFKLAQNGVNVKMETEAFQADKNPNVAAMNKIAQSHGQQSFQLSHTRTLCALSTP